MRGPYTRVFNDGIRTSGSSLWYRTDLGRKARIPLPYSKSQISALARSSSSGYPLIQGPWAAGTIGGFTSYSGKNYLSSRTSLENRCYARFVDSCQQEAMLAVNFAERKQTVELALSLARALRRPCATVGRAYQKYAQKAKHGQARREVLKDASDAWLAFNFGVKPLMHDLHSAVQILTDDLQPRQVRSTVTETVRDDRSGLSGIYYQTTGSASHSVKMSGLMVVTNPNAYYANQLGLLNPASIAWELIPFSFLVDWFANVGQMAGSMSDFVGLSLQQTYTTNYLRGVGTNLHWGFDGSKKEWESVGYSWVKMDRVLGITPPKFKVEFPSLGLNRLATAFALLVQGFYASGR